jgi:acetylornithine deacetylase/succinyl-diaminopimelate desuccinylase-like protein
VIPAPVVPATTRAGEASAWLAARGGELIAFCRELIQIPTDNPPGDCGVAADRVERELEALGLPVERYDVEQDGGPALPTVLGWLGPRTDAPSLVLNAHLDASPPTREWTAAPSAAELRDGLIFGRGATLAKSDVAGYVYALAAARAALGLPGETSAVVAVTSDEGNGGDHGPRYLLEQVGLRPRRALTAGFTHWVGIAHDGAVQARLVVRGRAAHQAVIAPGEEAMRTAVAAAARIVEAGDRLRARTGRVAGIPHPTLNVTRLAGGELFGMAPGTVELLVDRRVTPEEQTEHAVAELRELVASIARGPGTTVELELVQVAEPLRPSGEQAEWARLVQQEAEAVLGKPVPCRGVPLYTDARWFGAHGIPTVLYGAGGADLAAAGINGADENVAEADVLAAAAVVARVAVRVLEGR